MSTPSADRTGCHPWSRRLAPRYTITLASIGCAGCAVQRTDDARARSSAGASGSAPMWTPTTENSLVPTAIPTLRIDNPGSVARHQQILADVRSGGHRIAFIGDSITQGWSESGRSIWDTAWKPLGAVNCGVSGDRTQHVLGRLNDGLLEALAAPSNHIRAFVLLIGTNNLGQSSNPHPDTPEHVAAGVRAVITSLRTRFPHARIVVSGILPRGQHPGPVRDAVTRTNQLMHAWITNDAHARFLDLSHHYVTADGEIPARLMPDFLHLSPDGYKIWSDALRDASLGLTE